MNFFAPILSSFSYPKPEAALTSPVAAYDPSPSHAAVAPQTLQSGIY
jgi:hypothetical protein